MNETGGVQQPGLRRWTLDGEPFDLESSDLSEKDCAYAEQMGIGDQVLVGDSFAEFIVARVGSSQGYDGRPSATVAKTFSRSGGLGMWSSNPASRARATSFSAAYPVNATRRARHPRARRRPVGQGARRPRRPADFERHRRMA